MFSVELSWAYWLLAPCSTAWHLPQPPSHPGLHWRSHLHYTLQKHLLTTHILKIHNSARKMGQKLIIRPLWFSFYEVKVQLDWVQGRYFLPLRLPALCHILQAWIPVQRDLRHFLLNTARWLVLCPHPDELTFPFWKNSTNPPSEAMTQPKHCVRSSPAASCPLLRCSRTGFTGYYTVPYHNKANIKILFFAIKSLCWEL